MIELVRSPRSVADLEEIRAFICTRLLRVLAIAAERQVVRPLMLRDKTIRVYLLIAVLFVVSACGGPTGPTSTGYDGQWTGTTTQGRPISFVIESSGAVTSIAVGHEFNGCVGSQTFLNLNLGIAPDVQCVPGPCAPSIASFRGFGYDSGNPVDGPSTGINAILLSPTSAQGTINFRNFQGCGSAIGVGWNAARR